MTTTLKEIESLAKRYADRRAALAEDVGALHEQIEKLKRARLPEIKTHVAQVKDAQAALAAAIEASPELFVKPRTVTVHGVKVGFQKGKGRVVFDDAAKVVELIERHLPELAERLVKTTKKPAKEALLALDVATLKRIACRVTGTGDEVLIKDTTSDVDKLVEALLEEEQEEVES